jgi:tRNA(Arg) A34 adenosine deaminase TadA
VAARILHNGQPVNNGENKYDVTEDGCTGSRVARADHRPRGMPDRPCPSGYRRMTEEDCMRRAIALSLEMMRTGKGGPFGAVIARGGEIIAEGFNQVTSRNDPTAHAEVVAVRLACEALGTFDLTGCEIFTSCEPCPMCLSAIYWARLDKIWFANNRDDAAAIGFRDDFLYREIPLPLEQRSIPTRPLLRAEGQVAFEEWRVKPDKVLY